MQPKETRHPHTRGRVSTAAEKTAAMRLHDQKKKEKKKTHLTKPLKVYKMLDICSCLLRNDINKQLVTLQQVSY